MPTLGRRAALHLLLILAALLPGSAPAWNAAGHRLVAVIAWQDLDPAERGALLPLLGAHPEAARWSRRARPGDDAGAVLFSEASTWADDIRRDPRFYDERHEPPTPTLAGYPDMARRSGWHFVNWPIGEARPKGATDGELDRRLRRLGETLADTRLGTAQRAYALVWLIHLVGDVHQPLHVATRRDADGDHDAGGNGLVVFDPENSRRPETNLHAWWDDLPGPPWLRDARLTAAAERLRRLHPPGPSARSLDIDAWRDESHRLAAEFVYTLAMTDSASPDPDYRRQARRIAGERVALAGYRLAALLKALLAPTGGLESTTGAGPNSRPQGNP